MADINLTSESPIDLVMFSYALEHLVTIGRILKTSGGNALLIGLGGSGRQSLSKLATDIYEYSLFQIKLTKAYGFAEWREDMRKMTTIAGC